MITLRVERELEAMGYRVARNAPYAGGYTTEHYGRPMRRTHALQIEINRALYLDEAPLDPPPLLEWAERDEAEGRDPPPEPEDEGETRP